MKTKPIYLCILSLILAFSSCSDDEDDSIAPTLLTADAGEPQTVSPLTLVTLDGSASTGPEGFRYEWEYLGTENINLSSTSEAIVTFTPPRTGFYSFELSVRSGDRINTSGVQVTVEGGIELNAASFTSNFLLLEDINDSGPDYIVNQDLIISSETTLSTSSGFIEIAFAETAGLIVKGTLDVQQFTTIRASNENSWKGVLVDGGVINSPERLEILHGGSQLFEGQTETAAITVINQGSLGSGTIEIRQNEDASNSLGVLFHETAAPDITSGQIIVTNYSIPAKAPINLIGLTNKVFANDDNYDYIEISTKGSTITDGSLSLFLFGGKKYLLDKSFTAGGNVSIIGSTIYLSENTGIVAPSIELSNAIIEGWNDVPWKGVAATNNLTLNNATIQGAGSSIHDTGSFTTPEKTAVYVGGVLDMSSSNITNSSGHGIYISPISPPSTQVNIQSSTFENISLYDLSIPTSQLGFVNIRNVNNSWSENAVILRDNSTIQGGRVFPLANDAAYHNVSNLIVLGDLQIDPGVVMEFTDNTGLIVSFAKLTANGTSELPIIFKGINEGAGSWNGIELSGRYDMSNCQISDGGQNAFLIEKANIVLNGGSDSDPSPNNNYRFIDNTLSNSAGYGAVIRLGKFNPFQNNDTNTFQNNASGEIKLP